MASVRYIATASLGYLWRMQQRVRVPGGASNVSDTNPAAMVRGTQHNGNATGVKCVIVTKHRDLRRLQGHAVQVQVTLLYSQCTETTWPLPACVQMHHSERGVTPPSIFICNAFVGQWLASAAYLHAHPKCSLQGRQPVRPFLTFTFSRRRPLWLVRVSHGRHSAP